MTAPDAARPRFARALFTGRCRRRLLTGLVLMLLAAGYGIHAARRFATRGADLSAFDAPVVVPLAQSLVPQPADLQRMEPTNTRELYLMAVISDQQDVLTGLVVLALRLIPALTVGALGIVLVAGGSIEWEVRSEK